MEALSLLYCPRLAKELKKVSLEYFAGDAPLSEVYENITAAWFLDHFLELSDQTSVYKIFKDQYCVDNLLSKFDILCYCPECNIAVVRRLFEFIEMYLNDPELEAPINAFLKVFKLTREMVTTVTSLQSVDLEDVDSKSKLLNTFNSLISGQGRGHLEFMLIKDWSHFSLTLDKVKGEPYVSAQHKSGFKLLIPMKYWGFICEKLPRPSQRLLMLHDSSLEFKVPSNFKYIFYFDLLNEKLELFKNDPLTENRSELTKILILLLSRLSSYHKFCNGFFSFFEKQSIAVQEHVISMFSENNELREKLFFILKNWEPTLSNCRRQNTFLIKVLESLSKVGGPVNDLYKNYLIQKTLKLGRIPSETPVAFHESVEKGAGWILMRRWLFDLADVDVPSDSELAYTQIAFVIDYFNSYEWDYCIIDMIPRKLSAVKLYAICLFTCNSTFSLEIEKEDGTKIDILPSHDIIDIEDGDVVLITDNGKKRGDYFKIIRQLAMSKNH